MLTKLKEQKLLKSRGKQRTDSTHVLAAIRQVNRLELVGETLRHALNELAIVAPQWLKAQVTQQWFDRYGARFEQYRLPSEKATKEQLALTIGADGHYILSAIDECQTDQQLRQLTSVEILRIVWVQQYAFVEGELVWREPSTTGLAPNKLSIESPYDPEARNRTKRDTNWTGYTVHLTETCEEHRPNLITNVETTPATTPDGAMTQIIHENLAKKEPRLLKFRHREQHEALQAARLRQTTRAFKQDYALRAGVEGTFSQGTRCFDLRRTRYVGLAKTHLQHIATAAAMNLSRLMAWWQQVPKAKTRISPFAALGATT